MRVGTILSLKFPRRFLRHGSGRLTLTVIALVFGVALVCAMDLANRAVLRAFVEVIDTMAGRAALQVTAGGAPFAEDVSERLASVPGVEMAVPVVSATAFTGDGSGELMTVHGVDVTSESVMRAYEARDGGGMALEDPLLFLNEPDSIIVTRSFASRRGLHPDDHLELLTPRGRRTFTVRGLLDAQGIGRAFGGNLIVMDLPAAELAFIGPGLVNRIDVVVQPEARVDEVAAAVVRALPDGLHVESPSQRKADLNGVMRSLQAMLDAVSLIGLAAAALIIFNRLTTVFEARAWQLGILRAVGMRSKTLWWELLKESLLLGCVGVALGIPLGIAGGRLLLPVIANTAALNFKLVAPATALTVSLRSLAVAAVLGLGASLLAAALPAWRVARRPPAETIRGHGAEPRIRVGRRGWALRGAVAGGVVLAIGAQSATRSPAWGLVATALITVAAVLAAGPLLDLLSPWLVAMLRALGGPSGRFAGATITHHSGRAVLTTAMLGVGIGAVIWLWMLAYSFETSLGHALSAALQGDWVVGSSHIAQGFLEAPVDEELIAKLARVGGVDRAVGERLVDWRYGDGPVGIDAFDAQYFTSTAFGRWPLVGTAIPDVWEAVSAGTAVLVSGNLDLAVGDMLQLSTPHGAIALRVGGRTIDFASPRGTIILSRELYRAHWDDAQVTRVFVRVAPGAATDPVRAAIAQKLGMSYGLRILSARDLMDYFTAQVRRAFAPVGVLSGLVLVVLFVGLADALAASVLERTRELGVIRALGARRAVLRRAVVAEGLGLGVPGILLAMGTGLGLGTLWVRQTFPYLIGWPLETYVPYAEIALVCAGTLAVCGLAAVLPARRAAGLEVAEALRCE